MNNRYFLASLTRISNLPRHLVDSGKTPEGTLGNW